MPTHEPEITTSVNLCQSNGRLDPSAVGWTRHPLHRSNLQGWGRTKRWEYWGIVSPTHVIGLVASSLDYAGVHGIYVLDRATGEETTRDVVAPFARGASFPDRSGVGTVVAAWRDFSLEIVQESGGTTICASAPGVQVDLVVPNPVDHESLGVVVPWSSRRFQYTVKDVGRPVHGTLRLGKAEHTIDAADSFAVLDHGRGKWPYSMTWNWGAGSGHGQGIQLGGKWTAGTRMTENAVLVDGRIHKIGDELSWSYDRFDWKLPWRITGERVDIEFTPFHERVARTNLLIVASETHQCFGHFNGHAQLDDGSRIKVDELVGWAEEARQRW